MRCGRNVASYKFALGQALLELGSRQQTFVPLPDLAVPYVAGICEHLQVEDRQSTSAQSQFLDACRSRNRGELDAGQLAEVTVRLGFADVIDAFRKRTCAACCCGSTCTSSTQPPTSAAPHASTADAGRPVSRHGAWLTALIAAVARRHEATPLACDIDLDRVARVIGIELDRPATPERPSSAE